MSAHRHTHEDFYKVLGVPRTATAEEIKAAYRKLVLVHHPDRTHAQKPTKAVKDDNDTKIQRINAAYDTLNDANERVKYDFEFFGSSSSPDYHGTKPGDHGAYVGMTADDVDQMLSGLNTYERFSTAQYHAMRSARAPASIGRRRTNFHERKQFRASKLPSKTASVGWLCFPAAVLVLWGFNLSTAKDNAKTSKRF